MVYLAKQEDMPQLTQLWQQAFQETETQAVFALEEFAQLQHVYLQRNGEKITAMACAVPVTLKGKKGAYLYGVATEESGRNQGIMTAFLQELHTQLAENGCHFSVLIPASKQLFDFYTKRGYRTAFMLKSFSCEVKNNLWATAEFDTVTLRDFIQLRQQWAGESCVQLSQKAAGAVLKNLYSEGATSIVTEEGYGFFFIKNDEMYFEELFAQNSRAAEQLLQAARQQCGCETARGLLSGNSLLIPGASEQKPFGMICYLDEPFSMDDAYMNLMLN